MAMPIANEPVDAYVESAAQLLGLPLPPAWKASVKSNLETTLRLSATFADFPVPDEAEPAAVFVA